MLTEKTIYTNTQDNGGTTMVGGFFLMWWRSYWSSTSYRINVLSNDFKIDYVQNAVMDDFGTLVAV